MVWMYVGGVCVTLELLDADLGNDTGRRTVASLVSNAYDPHKGSDMGPKWAAHMGPKWFLQMSRTHEWTHMYDSFGDYMGPI